MRYVCRNEECPKCGVEEYLSTEHFKMKDGHLVGEHAACPACGYERVEVNPNDNIPLSEKNIYAGRYSSASAEEKREILKKRSHDHFNKEVKERKDYLMNKAMTEMKGMTKK